MKRFTPVLLASLVAVGLSCSSLSYAQTIKVLTVSQIRPTQPAIGDDEVNYKVATLQNDRQKLFEDFCKDMGAKGVKTFDSQSSLTTPSSFSCLAAVGTDVDEVKSAVIAPDQHIYLTDGHHTVSTYRALANNHDFPFAVRITNDFSHLASMDVFWSTMQQQHLTWLEDPQGNTVTPAQLPQQVGLQAMQNDPYRSVVYFLRGIAYDKPDQAPPFLEFYLGSWLRDHQPVKSEQLSTKAGYMTYLQQAASSLVAAQGDEHATAADDSPSLSQLGQRATVNKKKLAKLAEPGGKLSVLFNE
ncbi:ParB/Srx family N-terminal domain-containing protein [Rosenbergiella collisarenosi]|uniref:ParB/Srx family N-terminal domain-containing protein n=1 Tax=Rosenbergiella collisarenosi TaxID=1544695 RepID=UPI001F4F20B6|nr:ParB/Srx family N-terminal domain-containing protein [Rosenbergiella collisarenosi]